MRARTTLHDVCRIVVSGCLAVTLIGIPQIHGLAPTTPATDRPKVPDPWTPVTVEQDQTGEIKVSVWGRKYYFQDSPLPSRILSGEKELLAGPIRLTGQFVESQANEASSSGHSDWKWVKTGVTLWEHDDDHATLVGWMQNGLVASQCRRANRI